MHTLSTVQVQILGRADRLHRCTLVVALMAVSVGHARGSQPQSNRSHVDFNQDVRPILTAHCTSCHGGVQQAAGISFAYADDLLSVLEPGDPDNSYLIERVVTDDEDYRMPPPEHGPPLAEQEVAMLRAWIAQGAKWTKHWAYEPPERQPQPAVSLEDWCREPLDYFVLSKLEALNATPAEAAAPHLWLRRVSLDLIGLPPTQQERQDFVQQLASEGEAAYEHVVDRLLASPRFGERWASVWFDQVRYADSRGSGEDSPRDIWKYRDWVISALNQDLPYDEFTRMQIAGDVLPDRTLESRLATAVHRLTHTNEEGGTDDEEFRVAAVLDRVDTIWQVWQGTTMGCVQCHDHPYDPIRHEDFYRFMAYFNNTADCDLSDDWPNLDVPLDSTRYDEATKLDKQINDLRERLWGEDWKVAHAEPSWTPLRIEHAKSSNSTKIAVDSKDSQDRYVTVGTVARGPEVTARLSVPKEMRTITGIRLTALPLNLDKARKDAEVGFVMSQVKVSVESPKVGKREIEIAEAIGDEPFPYNEPQKSLTKGNEGFGAYTRIYHPRNLVLIPKSPVEMAEESELIVSVRYGVFDLAAFSLVARSGQFAATADPQLTELIQDPQRKNDLERLKGLQTKRREIPSIATPVLAERPEHLARESHRFDRGLFLTKEEQVQPGVPGLGEAPPAVPDRLALADWLTSSSNPLTSRVAANRIWARTFGIGLVATEGDFGAAGDWPSHPDLLDDLAVRFREEYDWSMKKLLREIALSSTYRQSAAIESDFQRADPQNRLLARGPRHLLPAETVRDQMLAVSDLLTTEMGGSPVFPPLPSGVWKARRGKWETDKVGDADRYRRSVYTYVKRSVPFPMHTTFDAPSRDVCVVTRLRSNTPLQSLMLLNDEASQECVAHLADLMQQHSDSIDKQIEFGFTRATCRPPATDEVARLVTLYRQTEEADDADAAARAVATVLLNLDEVVTN